MSDTAIERLALFFGSERTRQGLLARRALGHPDAGDPALADRLRNDLAAGIRPDGTVSGGAVPTIWRVHELLDLDERRDSAALRRALALVLDLQDRPGAFHDGCDRVRHSRQLCQHYLSGFFAPAPPAQRLAPVTLPKGKVFRVEAAARFAISCLALQAVLRAGQAGQLAVERHLQSLARIAEQWTDWSGYFAPDIIVTGLVTTNQAVDGEWPSADLFLVLDALLAAGTAEAQVTVRRAGTALDARQRADGTFGPMAQQERALIGLRALLWAKHSPA
jgi:hypothetical protein